MAAQSSKVKVIDQSQVGPPRGSVSTTPVPLTFFDVPWLPCPPMQRIFIYELPYPTLHFMQIVLPQLKQSLSLALSHFFPFAAKLTCPPPPDEPYIAYNEGDAVQVIVAESSDADDFKHLTANHARDVETLKSLLPKLPLLVGRLSSNVTHVVPTMAIQFTVFPNTGISIGVSFNHGASDGRSIQHFMKSWASIHRSQGDQHLMTTSLSLPYYDRNVIRDPQGLSSIIWKDLCSREDLNLVGDVSPEINVLMTFVIDRVKIEQLKRSVTNTQSKNDNDLGQVLHMSTSVVTCALMWTKLMKLQEEIRGSLDDDGMLYHLLFGADCRDKFELSIPRTYFGNCLTYVFVSATRRELMGEGGVVIAAKAIGRKIFELGSEGALIGAEEWLPNFKNVIEQGRTVTIAGSPKFRVYDTDFGWGRPRKSEVVHIAPYFCFSVSDSREVEGGVDIGVVVGRDKVELFNALMSH